MANTLKPYGAKRFTPVVVPDEYLKAAREAECTSTCGRDATPVVVADDMPMGYDDPPRYIWMVEFEDGAGHEAYWTYDDVVCAAASYIANELEADNYDELYDAIVDRLIDEGPDAHFKGSELVYIYKLEVN